MPPPFFPHDFGSLKTPLSSPWSCSGNSPRNILIAPRTFIAKSKCFTFEPNYQGGGQGPPTAWLFNNFGSRLCPADPDSILKIRQFRERLKLPASELEMSMMVVYQSCSHFIWTILSTKENSKREHLAESRARA
jgi:hypothetical protein